MNLSIRRSLRLLFATSLFFSACYAVDEKIVEVPVPTKRITLAFADIEVLFRAVQELSRISEYSDEQKRIQNYDAEIVVWDDRKEIEVRLIAIVRPGDIRSHGGNYTYARSVTFVFEKDTLRLLRRVGSR